MTCDPEHIAFWVLIMMTVQQYIHIPHLNFDFSKAKFNLQLSLCYVYA